MEAQDLETKRNLVGLLIPDTIKVKVLYQQVGLRGIQCTASWYPGELGDPGTGIGVFRSQLEFPVRCLVRLNIKEMPNGFRVWMIWSKHAGI